MRRLGWIALLVAALDCGGDPVDPVVSCEPACPAHFHCTEQGCVSDVDGGAADLSVAVDGSGCAEKCGGATPVCSAAGHCVACVVDGDCPLGNVCKVLSPLVSACLAGCNDDARCGAGAMKCCGGQCHDTSRDNQNCGSCGMMCTASHGSASCQGSQCVAGACNPGWGNCNSDDSDGCETNLRAEAGHCGACGMACQIANGLAGCDNAGCYLKSCLYGFDDCNSDPKDGCEIAVSSDIRNCGACAMVCPNVPHARSVCGNGVCQLTGCDAGFADCDGKPVNGCEITLANDFRNCGGCGNACGANQVCINSSCTCQQCSLPNARTRCVNLMCVFDTCIPGYGNCNGNVNDGCEVDFGTDARNCSGCGLACGGMTPFCQAGVCSNIGLSCADILKGNPMAKSGVYTIDPDGNGPNQPYSAYCDMTTDGGGWTAFFAGLNGSPNVFNRFEDSAVDCNDAANRCLRRLPANVTINSQFLVTCGNASLRMNLTQPTFTYFATGVQGGWWIANANQVAVGGNANPAFAANTWTGQGANKGWIISAGDQQQPRTFASSYNQNAQWDWCNGVQDNASPVKMYYR